MGSGTSDLALTQAEAQLRGLSQLQHRLARADATTLGTIRSEVMASVAATQALVQQAQTGAASTQTAQVALYAASEGARRSVTSFMHDYYDRHAFDRYLKFTSTEDEEEYRRREDERKKAIDAAVAEHTPEGNLKATDLSIEQLKDAGAHGADKSPEYKRDLDSLTKAHNDLQREIAAKDPVSRSTQGAAAESAVDPLQSVAAKAPHAKSVAATLLAAGITAPASDNIGHGVNDRTSPTSAPARGT